MANEAKLQFEIIDEITPVISNETWERLQQAMQQNAVIVFADPETNNKNN
jgi:5S rRNA maturation endonuclease (ribonuclease M5)